MKQTTFAVMVPLTSAPEEEIPPALSLVVNVAEMILAPHASPVAVIIPVGLTLTIPGVFEDQVTWPVTSFVTGGCEYEPIALS